MCDSNITYEQWHQSYSEFLDATDGWEKAYDPKHKLHSYFMSMTRAILEWENEHEPKIRNVSGSEMLVALMEAGNIKQKDISHIISQSSLSKVINSSRALTVGQIRNLSDFFGISSDAFV